MPVLVGTVTIAGNDPQPMGPCIARNAPRWEEVPISTPGPLPRPGRVGKVVHISEFARVGSNPDLFAADLLKRRGCPCRNIPALLRRARLLYVIV